MVKDERLSRSHGIRDSRGDRVFAAAVYVLVTLILILVSYPLIYVVSASFSNPLDIITGKLILFPRELSVRAYQAVFRSKDLLTGYKNTIIYAVAGTAINIILTTTGAYALSRKDMWGRTAVTFMISFTMFFGGGMIPTYMVNKYLGIVNTRWVMVLMGLVSVFNIIIVRTAFQAIPASLEESAQLDGAGHMTILFKITFPLAKATIAVITLFYAVGKWNDYLTAAIYLLNRNLYPLQLILREILVNDSGQTVFEVGDQASSYSQFKKLLQYSTVIFATLPILCVYPFVQSKPPGQRRI